MKCPRCKTVTMFCTSRIDMELLGPGFGILKNYHLYECFTCQAEIMVMLPKFLTKEKSE